MTDFDRVRNYYKYFDEQNRLQSSNSGRLEFETTMEILKKYLPEKATVLDLGGGAGAYSFPLAAEGYEKEEALYRLETENPEMFKNAMKLLNDTSEQKAIIEMCGHAIYVGCKRAWS